MLKTDRLLLHPLTADQLAKYIKNDGSLEKELGIDASETILSADLKHALQKDVLPAVADTTKDYHFSTLWIIISRAEHKIIGDICFVGEPKSDGETEIGYKTMEAFRNKGYMTEAVAAIITWAIDNPKVHSIFATTEKANTASCAILEKNRFQKIGETEAMFHWRLMTIEESKKND